MAAKSTGTSASPATLKRSKLLSGPLWVAFGVAALATVSLIAFASGSRADDAPNFRLVAYQGQEALGGNEIDFRTLLEHGQPVVLNFWAGLCPPCRKEMPGFQRVHEKYGDQFLLIGVDIGPFVGLGSRNDAQQFLDEFGITYPTGYSTTADPVRDYSVLGMPTTVFFTTDGEIDEVHTGFITESFLEEKLTSLLAFSN